MKRVIIGIGLALACAAGITGCSVGEKPFADIAASEISSASVLLTPPDKMLEIDDTEKLAELLQDVVIYGKDDSYTEYAGQGVTFTLSMADGSKTSVTAFNPFLIIDGTGYRTEYDPCEALNHYANDLLNSGEAVVILEEPPALTVVSDETALSAQLGSYSWQRKLSDGTSESVIADSAHPLDCRDLLSPLETPEHTAVLRFSEKPDSIVSVRCWSDAHWEEPFADSDPVERNGDTITLKPGGYIYEVSAQWDTADGYGGTADYSFYIKAK